jgi:hypothetical protein
MGVTARTIQLARDLRASIDALLNSLTRRLTAGWVDAWDRLTRRFSGALRSLLDSVGGRWPSRRDIARSAPLAAALNAAEAEHDLLVGELRAQGTAAARAAASAASTSQAGIIRSQLPTGAPKPVTRAAETEIEAIARRAADRIAALSDPLTPGMRQALQRELVRGINRGADPEQIAAGIVRRLEAQFHTGLERSLLIANTEVMDAYREAALVFRLANGNVLRGWMWVARCDAHTCPACWAMHGSEHPVDEAGPYDHPNGRCISVPLTRTWRELGFDMPEPRGEVPNAEAAFRSLSRDAQLSVMGPSRLAAYERGTAWADLATRRENPGWRPSYVPTPVHQLT